MEPANLVWFMSTLTFFLSEQVSGDCFSHSSLRICPSPVIVRPPQLNRVDIQCNLLRGKLYKLEIGVVREKVPGNLLLYYTVTLEADGVYKYNTGSRSFSPETVTRVVHNASSITLLLSEATLADLDNQWFCNRKFDRNKYSGQYQFDQFFTDPIAIPYPVNIDLALNPSKPTYHSHEIVSLQCTALSALNFNRTTPRFLKYTFQYFHGVGWVTINEKDSLQVIGVVAGVSVPEGIYLRRTYSLKLRVSSIPGCSRSFRCILSYGSTIFKEDTPQVKVNVTTCTGGCRPQTGDECQTTESPPQNLTTESTVDWYDDTKEVTAKPQASPSNNASFLIGVIVAAGLGLLIILVIVLILMQRRNRIKGNALGKVRRRSFVVQKGSPVVQRGSPMVQRGFPVVQRGFPVVQGGVPALPQPSVQESSIADGISEVQSSTPSAYMSDTWQSGSSVVASSVAPSTVVSESSVDVRDLSRSDGRVFV